MENNAETPSMDSVFKHLNELKQERSRLAQRLTEQQGLRQLLEQELEQVENEYSQMDKKHRRISEELAIAQKKMDQCIFSNSRLQEEIDKYKSTEKIVREACEFEKNSMVEYMDKFESTCKEIAEDLLQAKNTYRENALMGEMSETEKILQETKLKIDRDDKEIQELNGSIENLTMKESFNSRDRDVEIMINGLIRAIEVDNNESEAHLLQLQRELRDVHEVLQERSLMHKANIPNQLVQRQ